MISWYGSVFYDTNQSVHEAIFLIEIKLHLIYAFELNSGTRLNSVPIKTAVTN